MSNRVTVLITLEIDVTETDGFKESDYCDYAMNWLGEAMDFDKTGTGDDGISWKGSFPSIEANYVIDREVVATLFEQESQEREIHATLHKARCSCDVP